MLKISCVNRFRSEKPDLQECVIEYSIADTNHALKYNCDMKDLSLTADSDLSNSLREKIEIWHNNKNLPQSKLKKPCLILC